LIFIQEGKMESSQPRGDKEHLAFSNIGANSLAGASSLFTGGVTVWSYVQRSAYKNMSSLGAGTGEQKGAGKVKGDIYGIPQ
jgi:hypothetical protein